MNFTRVSHHLLAGAVGAALLAGCSAGSQFAPPTGSAGSQSAGFQQAAFQAVAPMHATKAGRGHSVSPDWVDWTGVTINPATGKLEYYYINIWNVWLWLPTTTKGSGGGHLGGSLNKNNAFEMTTTDATIAMYNGKTLVGTLTGLGAPASGVETDARGNTFASVNVSGGAQVEEFAAGDQKHTVYSVPGFQSAEGLGIDKAGNVYVEGSDSAGVTHIDKMAPDGTFTTLSVPGQSTLAVTPGGLAVQTSGKAVYLWVNDLGNASSPANITRYEFTGKSLTKQSSFDCTGINGAIAVDPTGKDSSHVYAMNNVPTGSEYSVSGIEYSYPSGAVVTQSSAQTASQEGLGIWVK